MSDTSKVDPVLPSEGPESTVSAGQQAPTADDPRPPARDSIGVGSGTIDTDRESAGSLEEGNGAASDASTAMLPSAEASEADDRAGERRTRRRLPRLPRRARKRAATPADVAIGEPVKIRSADVAGTVFARLTVLPSVLIVAWLIPGVLLLLAGNLLPVPMILLAVSMAAVLTVNGLRIVPASWPRLMSSGRAGEAGSKTWFGLLATVVVVAGLTAWQLTESSAALIVTRDQGVYFQAGYWLAQHGSLPIQQMLPAFGAIHSGLNFASTGFLVRGAGIYPAVMPGLPLLLAGGFWVHGFAGAQALSPILGGLATLSFAGLVGRLVGPQWAPAGALILGLSLPQQYVSRTSLAETALQIMLFGGLSLAADSLALRGPARAPDDGTAEPPEARSARARLAVAWQLAAPTRWASGPVPQRGLAVLAGLVLSLGLAISLEALLCLLAVIPFVAALAMGRRPQAAPFLFGLVSGSCFGLLSLYLLDRPLLDESGQTIALAGVVAMWLVALSVVAYQLARVDWVRRKVPAALARLPLRWLPEAGVMLTVAALYVLAIRPYAQQVHGNPSPAVYEMIKALQLLQGLPIDPTRTYAEQGLYWVIWYIGLPTVLLGACGLVIVVRRCLTALLTWRDPTGVWRAWGLPLAMFSVVTVVVLWAPHIVPDQPWASRRLIFMTIPGLIVFGLWAARGLGRWAGARGALPITSGLVGLFCAAAMVVPTAATTFGFGLRHASPSGGLKPVVHGLALTRTQAGEDAAVRQLCAALPSNGTIVIVDASTADEFSQVIRGMCDLPVASVTLGPESPVQSVIQSISAVGRRPILVAASAGELIGLGAAPIQILDFPTTEEPHDLIRIPTALQPVRYQVWAAEAVPGRAGL